jgi:hypothetical protein
MSTSKIAEWRPPRGKKLRVVFVDDGFWGYVDLPDRPMAQKVYENRLRERTGGTVSLYHPGSDYRDAVTPPLDDHNLI